MKAARISIKKKYWKSDQFIQHTEIIHRHSVYFFSVFLIKNVLFLITENCINNLKSNVISLRRIYSPYEQKLIWKINNFAENLVFTWNQETSKINSWVWLWIFIVEVACFEKGCLCLLHFVFQRIANCLSVKNQYRVNYGSLWYCWNLKVKYSIRHLHA